MTPSSDRVKHFLDLHRKGDPLLLANAWDAGSARMLGSRHSTTFARSSGRSTCP